MFILQDDGHMPTFGQFCVTGPGVIGDKVTGGGGAVEDLGQSAEVEFASFQRSQNCQVRPS